MESNSAESDSDSGFPVVPADELRRGAFQQPVHGLAKADAYDLSVAYRQALANIEEDSPEQRAWSLMHAVLGIGLQPDDRADPWKPLFSSGPRRSCLPEDFRGAQLEAFSSVLDEIDHPALRARLADIVWSVDRRQGKAAQAAVESYCACGEGILSGAMSGFGEERGRDVLAAVDLTHRALQIAYATSKRGQMPDRPKELIRAVFDASKQDDGYVALMRAGEIGIHFGALDDASAAADAEAVATRATDDAYAMAVHGAFVFAARLYEKLKDTDGRQRALKGALQQTLAMRKQVGNSAAAEGHWVMAALQELRHIDGMEALEVELEADLRRLQKASLKELGRFNYQIEVKDEREAVMAFFDACSLSEGLREFAILDASRDPVELRKEALEGLNKTPLSSMFSAVHMDGEGRTASVSAGASLGGEPDETWFNHTIGRSENFRRVYTIVGRVDPARVLLNARFSITERHLHDLVRHSPFVPASQAPVFTLGLARLFQGDLMSATHLLVPQLEPCLRYILKQNGHDPSKRRDDNTEEDLPLSGMFDRMRAELDGIMGADLTSEIDLLFNARPGPALRHELAHGQLSAGACFSEDVYYANWLLYRIAVLPLLPHWEKLIQPGLEQT